MPLSTSSPRRSSPRSRIPDSDHMWVTMVDVGSYNLGERTDLPPRSRSCAAPRTSRRATISSRRSWARELPGGIKIKKSKLRGVVVSWGYELLGARARALGRPLGHHDPAEGRATWACRLRRVPRDGRHRARLRDHPPTAPTALSMMGHGRRDLGHLRSRHAHRAAADPARGRERCTWTTSSRGDDRGPGALQPLHGARGCAASRSAPSPDWLASPCRGGGHAPHQQRRRRDELRHDADGASRWHAFDLGKLSEREGRRHVVVARRARAGETIQTLDGPGAPRSRRTCASSPMTASALCALPA